MTEDHIHSDNDNSSDLEIDDCGSVELRGILSKWTNYIHGWQDRFMVVKDGTLSYYKSEIDSSLGCRGALALKKALVKAHDLDDCRFDVSVNDCVWYLRAPTPEEKQQWVDVLKAFQVTNGCTFVKQHQRSSSLASLQSTSSSGNASKKLSEKLAELETYGELLNKQSEQLQVYYDFFVIKDNINDDLVTGIDAVQLPDGMAPLFSASEVRINASVFRKTCEAAVNVVHECADLMRQRERALKARVAAAEARAKESEETCGSLKSQLEVARIPSFPGPDFEEGPHSALPEDEFYDAVESGLDKMEEERSARIVNAVQTRDQVDLPPLTIDNKTTQHPLWPEIENITKEQLKAAFEGVGGDIGWQLFAEEGDMRMYRREVEVDGMVMDPLKAMHKVRGVTAREMCHYFFNPRYRHDWETTLETMTIVEPISSDTIIFHQAFKRVWPASQRDALFWSHVRSAPQNTFVVVNHSTTNENYPANTGACIRLHVTVCLACRTHWPDGEQPTRENITTDIAYCSTVNPGGWAPASVLRAVYKREYPKFLKRFTGYVTEQCRTQELAL